MSDSAPHAVRAVAWLRPLALLLFATVWLGELATRSLIGADEGRYASLSLAMLHSGDWITPRLNGFLYFEKPPLQYWGGALGMAVFGVNEFAARLWPGLCGLATVVLVAATARRMWGERAGWHALFIAASTSWIVLNSHFLSLDAGLTAALTLVLCAVLLVAEPGLLTSRARRRWMLAAWAGMALAVLSKGLIGIVIPGAVLVLHSLWRRDVGLWRQLEWWRGTALFLFIAAPWFVLVEMRNPGFAWFFFVHEHFERYLTTVHRREGAWWYFLPYLLVGFLPWTTTLPWLARPRTVRRSDQPQSSVGLLVTWALFVLVFFSASSSKLPSYILPMFPALALLLARRTAALGADSLRWHLLAPAALWLAALLAAPFAGRLANADTPLEAVQSLAWGAAIGAVLFLAGVGVAWALQRRGRSTAALGVVACAHLAATLVLLTSHDAYGQLKSSDAIVRRLAPAIDAGTPVFSVQSYDQTLPFYLGRPVILVDYHDEFAFGEARDPQRWIHDLDGFVDRWRREPRAAAYMSKSTYRTLRERGLAMRVVYEDARRLAVVKP